MLVKVRRKVTLGRTTYVKDDQFECRDAEAKILIGGGIVSEVKDPRAKPTKETPKGTGSGISTKKGKPHSPTKPALARPASADAEAQKERQAHINKELARQKELEQAQSSNEQEKPASNVTPNPVGAMTMDPRAAQSQASQASQVTTTPQTPTSQTAPRRHAPSQPTSAAKKE